MSIGVEGQRTGGSPRATGSSPNPRTGGQGLRTGRRLSAGALALPLAAAVVVAGCGGSKQSDEFKRTTLDVRVSEQGKTTKYTVPSSTKGGLVEMTLSNEGKSPHGGELVRIVGNHTPQEVLKTISSNSNKTPDWIRAEGGVGTAPPGGAGVANVNLEPGKYIVTDSGGPSQQGPPGYAQFEVKE